MVACPQFYPKVARREACPKSLANKQRTVMMQVMFWFFPQYSTYFSFANKSSWGNSVFIPEGKAKVINESIGLSMSVLPVLEPQTGVNENAAAALAWENLFDFECQWEVRKHYDNAQKDTIFLMLLARNVSGSRLASLCLPAMWALHM